MDLLASFFRGIVEVWRGLPLGPFEKGCLKVLIVAFGIYFLVYVIERLWGTRTDNYRSRAFLHDLAYWFYYRSGIHDLLFMVAIIAVLEKPLSFLAADLFVSLPYAAQVALYLVIGDFIAYWIHRAEHRFKFMWAFHTTHHSQERLTFATTTRFHPVEMIYHNLLAYVPLRIMGIDPTTWLPMYLAVQLYTAVQHTQIPWKLGPLYKIMATPTFHSYHHSVDPAHHDRNFSNMFSLWDYLFGTVVRSDGPRPSRLGLENVRPASLLSTLVTPFRLLYDFYIVPARGTIDKP